MNGVHDMGGMDGFGAVRPEADEPVFHAKWEERVLTMVRALGVIGAFNIDASRYYRETLPPGQYLTSSYYEKWYHGLVEMLIDRGIISAGEIDAGHAIGMAKPLPGGRFTMDHVKKVMTRGAFERPASQSPQLAPGDVVRAKNMHPVTHTRLPRYARGRVGTVERIQGFHVFPDRVAHGHGEHPEWLYTVVFDGDELWGAEGNQNIKVSIEAFESYLERV